MRAIRLDGDGKPIKGSEQVFDDEHWQEMERIFGRRLRWEAVPEKKEKKVRKKKTTPKYQDMPPEYMPSEDYPPEGYLDAAPDEEKTETTNKNEE